MVPQKGGRSLCDSLIMGKLKFYHDCLSEKKYLLLQVLEKQVLHELALQLLPVLGRIMVVDLADHHSDSNLSYFLPMLSLTNITKSYLVGNETIEILKGINVTIEDGEFVAIM